MSGWFDWIDQVGPNTWAVIILVIVLAGLALLMKRGLGGYLVGGLLSCFAIGGLARIVFYDGARFPGLELPVGVAFCIGTAAFLGFNLIFNRSAVMASGGGRSMRDHLPEYNTRTLVAVISGAVLIGVAFVFVAPSFSLNSRSTNEGMNIATDAFNSQSKPYLTRVERFLAR